MKKILCGFLCASAGVALAVESTVTTIDVIEVKSGLTNVVIAIPGLDLAGGELAISNLVKTTNLDVGDRLIAFNDGNYECWTLNAAKKWENTTGVLVDGFGHEVDLTSSPASDTRMLKGQGIWLSRSNPSVERSVYIYGAHSDTKSTSVTGTNAVLVGNPTLVAAAPVISGSATNDVVAIPQFGKKLLKRYQWTGTTWSSAGDTTSLPATGAGTGFWYIPASSANVTITWL